MFTRRSLLLSTALPFLAAPAMSARAQDGGMIGPMREMLALLPPQDFAGDSSGRIFSWADHRALLEALDIPNPAPGDYVQNDALFEATRTISLESSLFTFMLSELPQMIGFSLQEVDQVLVAFVSPDRCRVYRGAFDVDTITSTLTTHDYTVASRDDWTLLSSPGGDRLDLDSPIDSLTPGEFHYVMIKENMIVTTGHRSTIDAVLAVPDSGRNLLADLEDAEVLPEIENATSAILLDGSTLSYETLGTEPIGQVEELPRADWFAAGIWYGPGSMTTRYLVEFGEAEAEVAAAVIEERLESGVSVLTGQPYHDVFGDVAVAALPERGIVAITGESQAFSRSWYRAIAVRDLLFLATR